MREFLRPLFEFPEQASASQFRNNYLELCERLGLLHWYGRQSEWLSERQKEHNFRAYNRFVKVFERSIWSLNLLYGQQPIKRRRLLESLQRALLTATYNLTEWPELGVQILPRLEILALDFDVLFIGGLVDGDFPRASVKDIFFNDRLRMELGLTASEELLDQDRFLFYQLLESQAKTVFLTFPQFQDEEALVPSSFLADLKDIAVIDEQTPQDGDPLFENRKKLWSDFGQHVRFITQSGHKEEALGRLRLLQALLQGSEGRLAHLLDQIRISLDRNMGLQFSAYEGNLTNFPEITTLLQQKFGRQTWSVSRLETYAQCPMKFFLQNVLKVEPPVEIEEELTPQERGMVVHRILFRFFTELKNRGQQRQAPLFKDLLQKIAVEELAKLPYQGLFWEIEKRRFLGYGQINGILPAFLETEEERMKKMPFIPQYFELSFGFSGDFPADPNSISTPVTLQNEAGQLRLQGRIDRVDVDENGHAVIIDYKTGQVGNNLIQEVLSGKMLQIPLYLSVLPEILPETEPVFGGLYSLKDPAKIKLTPVLA
ncbi:MAG TPA: hypothetical protein ENL21_03605, partial [Caldithrix abyssi]|nr:hypothetical protein [Caldithrix abyssi]